MALRISIGGIAKRSGFFAMCVGHDGKVLIPLWFVHEDSHLVDETTKNGKISQIFNFKLLKDGNLLCEALAQNCSDLSHIFAESRLNRVLFRNRSVRLYIPAFQT